MMGPDLPERGRLYSSVERGLVLEEHGRHEEALAMLEPAYSVILKVQQLPTPQRAETLMFMGRAQMGLGKYEAALPLLEQAQAIWQDFDAQSRWAAEATSLVARCRTRLK
jgi:tetratricopeptide (TPR) repeat protein